MSRLDLAVTKTTLLVSAQIYDSFPPSLGATLPTAAQEQPKPAMPSEEPEISPCESDPGDESINASATSESEKAVRCVNNGARVGAG